MKSDTVKYGLIGACTGAGAPVFYSLLHRFFFHPDMSLSEYLRMIGTAEEFATHLFIGGTVVVMGVAGILAGRLKDNDARRRAQVEARNMELSALNSVADIIATTRDLDKMLELVLRQVLSLSFLSIEKKGAIFVRDEADPDLLRLAAGVGMDRCPTAMGLQLRVGQCLCGKVAQTGETIFSADSLEDADHTIHYPGMSRHGHIVVPIADKKRNTLGVLNAYLPAGAVPSQGDVRILTAVASQLAVAVENVNLLKRLSEAKEDAQQKSTVLAKNFEALKSLVEVDRLILSSMDRDDTIARVCLEIRQVVQAEMGGVALADPRYGHCRFLGGWGMDLTRGEVVLPNDDDVLRFGHDRPSLHVLSDDSCSSSLLGSLLCDAGAKSCIVVPLIQQAKLAGIFFLGSREEDGLTWEEFQTAVTFASRMCTALEHSRLIIDLEELSVNIIHALASAIDAKSAWTKGHSERVAEYAVAIAGKMGLEDHAVERLRLAGLLHDIGKIGTYDVLLDKSGKLTEEELELIKRHPDRGCDILAPIKELADLMPAVRYHHERWDGAGYPAGLKGEEIPLGARILCVADSFDTMTADRPYRPSIGLDNAVQELKYCSGSQFAPGVVEVFLEIIKNGGGVITGGKTWKYPSGGRVFAGGQDM